MYTYTPITTKPTKQNTDVWEVAKLKNCHFSSVLSTFIYVCGQCIYKAYKTQQNGCKCP